MSDEELGELIGDFAVAMESLKQCLSAITSLRPDLAHSFLQQANNCVRMTDRWLPVSAQMIQGSDK